MVHFGEFKEICAHSSSYTPCNLFYLQLQRSAPGVFTKISQRPSAPVGINPGCGIPKIGTEGSSSNKLNTITCAVAILVTVALLLPCRARDRKGRVEFRVLLVTYLMSLVSQILTAGALLEQGTKALGALTAIQSGILTSLSWVILWNATRTYDVSKGREGLSLIIMYVGQVIFFISGLYLSLDTAFGFTSTFGSVSNPPESISSVPLFILLLILPIITGPISTIIVCRRSKRRFWTSFAATFAFGIGHVFRLSLVGEFICKSSNGGTDASFLATTFETVAVVCLWFG